MGSWQRGLTLEEDEINISAVTKGTDQIFLFMSETVWTQATPTPQDMRMADTVGQQWTDFAKNGSVSPFRTGDGGNSDR